MKQKKSTIPWHLLALDIVGAVLFAAGFYQYISEDKGVFYMVFGLLLMVPLILYIVNFSQQSKKQR